MAMTAIQEEHDPPEAGARGEVSLAGITSRQLTESRSTPTVEVTSWAELCPPRGQCGATALEAHSEPLFKDSEKWP
jgi:hypothetical protein